MTQLTVYIDVYSINITLIYHLYIAFWGDYMLLTTYHQFSGKQETPKFHPSRDPCETAHPKAAMWQSTERTEGVQTDSF